ncbi:MAG: hypothetical protein FD163_1176 [Hyphomonadaceae bacterium]|nr:MAG: hypothetical protein FD128_1144 [Hyphomonadaceae bacterium]KAF0185361.1 MAG: hypothetical protein FD163_1176 [Hyphomonadaceae bacterium]
MVLAFGLIAFAPTISLAQPIPNHVAIERPMSGTVILAMKADITLSELTATGTADPKLEWAENARRHIEQAISARLTAQGYVISRADPTTITDDAALQVLKLNDAVDASIMSHAYAYGTGKLPTKTSFDWTIGEGASLLIPADARGAANAPRYALFVKVKGSYSSGARKLMMIGAAIGGVGIPMASQAVEASVVDLQTGRVIWHKFEIVGLGVDIRTEAGAKTHIESLFKDLPL